MAEGGVADELVEQSVRSGSEFEFQFYCELCRDDDLNAEANGYCQDCREYMCSSCIGAHSEYRRTRKHEVLDQASMPKGTPLSQDRVNKYITTKCPAHKSKTVKFYCLTHEALGCSICFATVHKQCAGIESIHDQADTLLDSQEFNAFSYGVKTVGQMSRDKITKTHDSVSKSRQSCDVTIKRIRQMTAELCAMFRESEQNLVTQLTAMTSEDEAEMERLDRELTAVVAEADTMKGEIEDLVNSKRVCQLYVYMREMQREVSSLNSRLKSTDESTEFRTFTFEPNTSIRDSIEAAGLGKVGHTTNKQEEDTTVSIDTNDSKADTADILRIDDTTQSRIGKKKQNTKSIQSANNNPTASLVDETSNTSTTHRVKSSHTSKAKQSPRNNSSTVAMHVDDIDVSSKKNSHRCYIMGSAMLSDTTLIAVDRNNWRTLLVDTASNKLKSEVKVSDRPFDVAVISDKQVAVSTWRDKYQIILLNVADTLSLDRAISVSSDCRGVAFCQNELLVTFYTGMFQYTVYGKRPRLETMDLKGKVTKSLVNSADGSQLFSAPRHICVGKTGTSVYVSDISAKKVVHVTLDGKIKSIYSACKDPHKICEDHYGNIYIADGSSRAVHMVTADCKKIKDILTRENGLNQPVTSVSHCRTTNRLYVGMEECNVIKVYQLS